MPLPAGAGEAGERASCGVCAGVGASGGDAVSRARSDDIYQCAQSTCLNEAGRTRTSELERSLELAGGRRLGTRARCLVSRGGCSRPGRPGWRNRNGGCVRTCVVSGIPAGHGFDNELRRTTLVRTRTNEWVTVFVFVFVFVCGGGVAVVSLRWVRHGCKRYVRYADAGQGISSESWNVCWQAGGLSSDGSVARYYCWPLDRSDSSDRMPERAWRTTCTIHALDVMYVIGRPRSTMAVPEALRNLCIAVIERVRAQGDVLSLGKREFLALEMPGCAACASYVQTTMRCEVRLCKIHRAEDVNSDNYISGKRKRTRTEGEGEKHRSPCALTSGTRSWLRSWTLWPTSCVTLGCSKMYTDVILHIQFTHLKE